MRSPHPNGSPRYPSRMAASARWSSEAAKTERSTKNSSSSTKPPSGPVSGATATTATQRPISPPYAPPYTNSRTVISPTNYAERCRDCLPNPINRSATSDWISVIPAHPKNFRRQLDLDTACVTASYEVEGVAFQRAAFVSAPDQVLVLRVTGSKLHQISGVLNLDGPLQKTVKTLRDNRLLLTGKAAAHIAGAGHPHSEQPVTLSDESRAGMYFAAIA